ncbi:MAG: hypothetical protein EKK37_10440 [Sphingobacteriales bacterium]|nr:MAG: hypothetical protein EKK37_10440 [Sphingobacteriales bacterium]
MDILLTRKYKYTISDSIDSVRNDFGKITKGRWFDFSNNITGTLNDDNTFKLTHKWTLGYIRGFGGNSFAYLKGNITTEDNKTIINVTLRPNITLTFFFYFISILFLCELFGIKTMLQGPRLQLIFTLLLFVFIIGGLMLMMTNGLRNRFERILQLTRQE